MSWHSGFQLKVVEGPDNGRLYHLRAPIIIIGRARPDDQESPGWVFLHDPAVSRQHGNLRWDDDNKHYVFLHRSGTNLSWLNGEPVTESPLKVGDVLKIGPIHLEVQVADPATAPEPAPKAAPLPTEPATVEASKPAPKTLQLRVGFGFRLEVEAGPGQGTTHELTGLFLAVGRNSTQPPPTEGDANPRQFDQLVELSDPSVKPNHLVLRWRETDKAYGLFRHPEASPVKVLRSQDGLEWEAWLVDQSAVLRQGDRLVLGSSILRLTFKEDKGERKISL